MCGIVGAFKQRDLKNSLLALHHRGPDFANLWSNEIVALGHTRLAILDLSEQGQQPMQSASGRFVIVFNGEIYNFQELRSSCGTVSWRGHSDTEVILALFEKQGIVRTLPQLSGMFAIAVWDCLEQTLTLARDRLGEKPLYYGEHDGDFAFASELKAIRPLFTSSLRINPIAVQEFMNLSYIPGPLSIYEGIHKLEPGHYLTIRKIEQGYQKNKASYWSLASKIQAPRSQQSFQENKVELEQRLKTVLSQELISDVPLGAFLSGGIDSTLIVAMMQSLSSTPIKTFTIGFENQDYNEAKSAKAIAEFLKTEHHEWIVNPTDLLQVIPQLPMIYDEPFADSSQLPTYLVAKMTKQEVTVALSGDGGDELMGGYNRYIWGPKCWKIIRNIPAPLRKSVCLMKYLPGIRHHGPRLDKLQKIERICMSQTQEELYFNLIKTKVDAKLSDSGLHFEAASQFDDYADFMTYHDLLQYLPDDILVKVDRAAMSHSLETRAPYLHPLIVDFSLQLPMQQKIIGSQGKCLMRALLSDYVPDSLWSRPKMGFGIPLREWLRGPLRDWAETLLSTEALEAHQLLPTESLREKWKNFLTATTPDHYELWNALMFQAWYQQWMRS